MHPVEKARQTLMTIMSEEDIEPMAAATAMAQLAAKISHDADKQDGLTLEKARQKWITGCNMAFDAVAEGQILNTKEVIQAGFTRKNPKKRFGIMCGGKGPKGGFQHRKNKNKMAAKSRRGNR